MIAKFYKNTVLFILTLGLLSPSAHAAEAAAPIPNTTAPTNEYSDVVFDRDLATNQISRVLNIALQFLTRKSSRTLMREIFGKQLTISKEIQERHGLPESFRDLTESQFIEILIRNPELMPLVEKYVAEISRAAADDSEVTELEKVWNAKIKGAFGNPKVIEAVTNIMKSPLSPLPLLKKSSPVGFTDMTYFANHRVVLNENGRRKILKPSNLKQIVIDFIKSAKKEIAVNVFDFDLKDVAQALIDKANSGVRVRVGIDGGVIKARTSVQEVVAMLTGVQNLTVHAVNAVGLNHQKLITADWTDSRNAKVLMSSGNFTQSCIGPEGDGILYGIKHKYSVPNANHLVIVKGQILAQLVNHELTKTIDPEFQLRGKEYPISGAYQIFGQKKLGGYTPYIIISFTPGGGLGNVNRDMIAEVIRRSNGPIRMVQFVTSSPTVENALFNKMLEYKSLRKKFDFASVADTPFAMREFSMFLKMSGYERNLETQGVSFLINPESRWRKEMSKRDFTQLQNNIHIAPPEYKNNFVNGPNGKKVEINAKIHHKMLTTTVEDESLFATPKAVTITGSYNFSDAAGSNQEYIAIIVDEGYGNFARGIFTDLFERSGKNSVAREAERRNKSRAPEDSEFIDLTDSENVHVEKTAGSDVQE